MLPQPQCSLSLFMTNCGVKERVPSSAVSSIRRSCSSEFLKSQGSPK